MAKNFLATQSGRLISETQARKEGHVFCLKTNLKIYFASFAALREMPFVSAFSSACPG